MTKPDSPTFMDQTFMMLSLFSSIERLNCDEEIKDHDINVLARQGKALAEELAVALQECGVSNNHVRLSMDQEAANG